MEETNKSELQCVKCGNLCDVWSKYKLVMCPSCKTITDVSIECDENDDI